MRPPVVFRSPPSPFMDFFPPARLSPLQGQTGSGFWLCDGMCWVLEKSSNKGSTFCEMFCFLASLLTPLKQEIGHLDQEKKCDHYYNHDHCTATPARLNPILL